MVSWMDQSLSFFCAYAYAVPSAWDFVLFLNWLYLSQPVITSKLQKFFPVSSFPSLASSDP